MNIKINLIVGCINLYSSVGEIGSLELSTSRYSPSVEVGGSLTPDVLGEGSNVRSGASRCLDSVLDVDISGSGGCRPGEGRVESSEIRETSILYVNL